MKTPAHRPPRPLRPLEWAALAAALLLLACTSTRSESDFEREVALFAELLALAPGRVVADIGAGDGDYAFAIAGRVAPGGKVLATELDDEKLEELRARAAATPGAAVEIVRAEVDGTGLPAASCDAALLRDVFHHVTAPEPFLANLFETIRPGGRLVIVDFPPTFWLALWTPPDAPESRGGHGIARELLIEEARAAGFLLLETVDAWPSTNFVTRTYGVAFERP